MKVQEQFVIDEAAPVLWEFFDQVDRVARCVPGVEEVTVVDADNSKVRVTQALGPMSATFDLKMRITGRDPGRSLEFTAIGKSVKGAAGNLRATNVVHLDDAGDGATRVSLDGDLALGGMLGSLGQKVVAKQAGQVTKEFARALERELKGEPEPAAEAAPEPAAVAPEPAPVAAEEPKRSVHPALVAAVIAALLVLVVRLVRSR